MSRHVHRGRLAVVGLLALGALGAACVRRRVAEVAAISGLRGPRLQVAATVGNVARGAGHAVAVRGAAPDTLLVGPVTLRDCRVTYHVTFGPAEREPPVLVFFQATYTLAGDKQPRVYLAHDHSPGCGRDAWRGLMGLVLATDSARRAGR